MKKITEKKKPQKLIRLIQSFDKILFIFLLKDEKKKNVETMGIYYYYYFN